MSYKNILFDLDGTLTDSGLGITNGVRYSLSKFGIEENDRVKLNRFVGPPLLDAYQNFYGLTPAQAEDAVKYYREYYSQQGLFENMVYPGIEEMLQKLIKSGKNCVVATSKPESFSKKILEHFHLINYFSVIAGATMDGTRSKKADVIAYALETAKITDLSSCLMVGDREHDVLGAKKTGIDCVGVLYGYGNKAELETAGATFIVETPADLLKILNLTI